MVGGRNLHPQITEGLMSTEQPTLDREVNDESPQEESTTVQLKSSVSEEPNHADCCPAARGMRFLIVAGALAITSWMAYWAVSQSRGPYVLTTSVIAPSSAPDVLPTSNDDPSPAESIDSLADALRIARECMERMDREVTDYTATMIKRERVGGKLLDENHMFSKIRSRKLDGEEIAVPLSVYLKFQPPSAKAGREVIWVEHQNDGKLVVHETGLVGLLRVKLQPTSLLAMSGNRYPITEIGIRNLLKKLVEKGENELKEEECQVTYTESIEFVGRDCSLLRISHHEKKPEHEFAFAEIYIDNELQLPLCYGAYDLPEKEGGEPLIIERYIYKDLKLNVGLTDSDFDPDNPDYDYP